MWNYKNEFITFERHSVFNENGKLYKYIHKLKANNITFVDFSPTAFKICFTEGQHNCRVGFKMHI